MNPFTYSRADDVAAAVRDIASGAGAKFIAGGTNLLDLMKENVERPGRLVDINRLALREIRRGDDGGLEIGALVTNTDVAYDERVERGYPLLSRAILAGASAQLRNMATTGGNLMQRTRCAVLLRHRHAVQQARAGQRVLGHRGVQPLPRDPGPQRVLHRDAPVRHVRGAGGPGGRRPRDRAGRRPVHPDRRVPPPARRQPPPRHHPGAGRAHHRGAPARRGIPRASRLPEGPRPHLLRLRPGLGRRRPADGRRHDRGGPHRPGRGGPQALARPATPRRSSGARSRRGTTSRGRPTPSSATPGDSSTTRSRSSWPAGRSSAPSPRPPGSPAHEHRPHRPAGQPRRRPRQGDGRGEVRRRVRRPGPRPRLGRLQPHRPGEDRLDRRERGAEAARGDPGLLAREHLGPRVVRFQLPRPGRAARLPVPPALRRGGPFQRPAGGPGRRRLAGAGPVRLDARADRVRDAARTPRTCTPTWRRRTRRRSGTASSRRRRRAATPTRPSPRPRCGSMPSTRCRSSTTTRWRCSRRRWCGTRTGRSPSTTRPRACRTSATTSATCSASSPTRSASSPRMSAGPSARACAPSTRSSSRRSPPAS